MTRGSSTSSTTLNELFENNLNSSVAERLAGGDAECDQPLR
jgi:hypothetical protein